MNRLMMLLVVLGAVALSACGPHTSFTLPPEFVAMTDDAIEWEPYDWKAVNADGAVVVLRERDNDEEGSLDFWAAALKREIVATHGYELLEEGPFEARNMKGQLFDFKVDRSGVPYRYTVVIFVVDDQIVTVETATREDELEAHGQSLRQIVESARFD